MVGGGSSAGDSGEDRMRRSKQAWSQYRIKGRFARARAAPATSPTAVEYNLDEEEDIKPSAEDLMAARTRGNRASAAKKTRQRATVDQKRKGSAPAPDSAAAKNQRPVPIGKRGRGSSSTQARNQQKYETSSGDSTSSDSSGTLTGVPELVRFHIECAQIDIKDFVEGMNSKMNKYVKGMNYKLGKYVEKRMKTLVEDVRKELDDVAGSSSGK